MRLFFKLRDVDGINFELQKTIIEQWLMERCEFKKYGLEIVEFIDHISDGFETGVHYAVGVCMVEKSANFEKLEVKTKENKLHDYFTIYAEL